MNKYEIYQIDLNDPSNIFGYAFRPYEALVLDGLSASKERYALVYTFESEDALTLEDIYRIFNDRIFNVERPEDFKGHSLSVSDVVKMPDGYWYCDSFGWVRLKEWEDAD